MNSFEFHPLGAIFPLLEGKDFDELVEDIRRHGLHEPIVLHEGKILDGRHRYRACAKADIAPRFETYTGADPLGYVVSLNLKRRHLDESQRAMVAATLANMRQGERTDLPSANLQKVDRASAAEMLGVSERSVASAAKVREHGAPELVQAVETGTVKVSVAADIATLSKEEQHALLAKVDNREILLAAKEIRAKRAIENRAKWSVRVIELSKANAPLPCDRRYPVIYADPAWVFDVYDSESGLDRAAAAHYPTMELKDISHSRSQTSPHLMPCCSCGAWHRI
jgi:hypothetical protein